VLLVLDNFEQVVAAGADRRRPAARPPGIKVVVTSRRRCASRASRSTRCRACRPAGSQPLSGLERLAMPGEDAHRRPGALGQYAAVRLFIERAVAVRPGFMRHQRERPAVAAICARLHGMPLAIELAAARIKLLSPRRSSAGSEHQLDLLAAGARDLPPRQQTLRAAIAWSYDILDEGRSGCSTGCRCSRAAATSTSARRSAALVGDRRRHRRRRDGLPTRACQAEEVPAARRPVPLLDTIREYAASSSTRAARRPRSGAPPRLVRGARPRGRRAVGSRPARWLDRLELEHDDIRAVLDRAVARPIRRSRSASRSRCGASGRSTATSPRRGRGSRRWPRRRGRTTIRGSARS
jgi:hypothetical protein